MAGAGDGIIADGDRPGFGNDPAFIIFVDKGRGVLVAVDDVVLDDLIFNPKSGYRRCNR